MYATTTSIVAALALLGSVNAQTSATSPDLSTSTACPAQGGAHVVIARGSLEVPPYGVLVSVKDKILAALPGSNADGTIGYPNTLQDYFNSESSGVIVARQLITDFVARCPGSPLVLFGYSQGANIIGDALLGQRNQAFPDNATISSPLTDKVFSQVAALILLGDPTFVVAENSFNAGNATKNGTFPRQNADLFNSTGLSANTRAYCDEDDLFCASGKSLAVHVTYVQKYGDDMAQYAINQVKKYYAAGKGSGATGTATGAVTLSTTARPSKTAACQSASSGAVRSSRTSSATGAGTPPTATQSSTVGPTGPVSTGAASALNAKSASVAGAVFAGLLAALL